MIRRLSLKIIDRVHFFDIKKVSYAAILLSVFLVTCTTTSTQISEDSEPVDGVGMSESTKAGDFAPLTEYIPGSSESIEMVPVPGGSFMMGPINGSGPYEVEVDSFWIGKYEVTWNQYNLFANESIENIRRELYQVFYGIDIEADAVSSPTLTDEVLDLLREAEIPADVISTPSPAYGDLTLGMGSDGYPAINVTHYAAVMFTKWLTVKTGNFYRLPTEAEWEFSCRAGADDEYRPPSDPDKYAWHRGNSNRSYGKVGSREPNALGIYDMLGNVTEWTIDEYHEDYFGILGEEPIVNPIFLPTDLYPRATRGGSWVDDASAASCLHRRGSSPAWKMNDPQLPKSLWWHTNAPFVGFRVVMPKNQPESVEEMEKYWIEAIQDYY